MQLLKFAGCAGVATGSILVFAYILMYYTKNRGFENQWFLKEGLGSHGFFSEEFENDGFEDRGLWYVVSGKMGNSLYSKSSRSLSH